VIILSLVFILAMLAMYHWKFIKDSKAWQKRLERAVSGHLKLTWEYEKSRVTITWQLSRVTIMRYKGASGAHRWITARFDYTSYTRAIHNFQDFIFLWWNVNLSSRLALKFHWISDQSFVFSYNFSLLIHVSFRICAISVPP